MPTHVRLATLLAAGSLAVTGLAAMAPASIAGSIYDNCTSYHVRFPHGVGRVSAQDHTSGTPVTNFKRSNRLYHRAMLHNNDLDRDGDHIACEKA